jgi:hypothetical protein
MVCMIILNPMALPSRCRRSDLLVSRKPSYR